MKKVVLAIVCVFMFFATATAQENEAFKEDTVKLLKITSQDAFEQVINQMARMVSEDKKSEFKVEAAKTLDGVIESISKIYMAEFTHDEIKDLLAFYATPTGFKMAEKTMVLAQKSMVVGQTWGMELQGIASKFAN